jgi:glucose/arabinose dehydrogenase/cytochrome c5
LKVDALSMMSWIAIVVGLAIGSPMLSEGQNAKFHNAPVSAGQQKNPYSGQKAAVEAGAKLYTRNCGACHGREGRGTGNVPPLNSGAARSAKDGEIFWYVTKGDVGNGMPSWAALPAQQRWQIITYLRELENSQPSSKAAPLPEVTAVEKTNEPLPKAPFTDFRVEAPGKVRKITVEDLPEPYATKSANNGPEIVARPQSAWPKAPSGFKVEQFATGLENPRLMRTAPNGDIFLAESSAGDIKVFRGITREGKPEQTQVFASGLTEPFGIAFYPPGPQPEWVYIGDTDAVVRFPYRNDDLQKRGPMEHIADLPHGEGHWTRDIQFSPDGKIMFVSVGSASNVDDPDTTPEEKNRADILAFNPDGSGMRIYAYGIRNAVGLAVDPNDGALWCSVNERDGLGDDLVPDYITHVQEGGFYGWPWWYMGGHQDPRHTGTHPELKDKVITPDVVLQPHNASLEMTFYEGKQFPADYKDDVFASEHGSWNRSVRAGYEVIRVPMHHTGHANGEYEDFLTGFVVDNGHVWGRPVGVTVAADGSLLVSDDGSNSIWRISYAGSRVGTLASRRAVR